MTTPAQQANLNAAQSYLANPYVKAFLILIGQTEGANYNTLYGGGAFSSYASFPGSGANTASGKYQILRGTYNQLSQELGLTDFSPQTQDLMAVQRIIDQGTTTGQNLIGALTSGNLATALPVAAGIWSSLPVGPSNLGHYPDQTPVSYNKVQALYNL